MNSLGRALGEEVAVLKVQRVILTVFTLFIRSLHMFRLRIRGHTRAKHRKESSWAGTTRGSIWPRNRAQNWGRSSPTQGFARVQIDRRAVRNLLFLGHLLDRRGEREGDGSGDLCLSCTRHLPTLQRAVQRFDIVESSTIKEALKMEKVRKNLAPVLLEV